MFSAVLQAANLEGVPSLNRCLRLQNQDGVLDMVLKDFHQVRDNSRKSPAMNVYVVSVLAVVFYDPID